MWTTAAIAAAVKTEQTNLFASYDLGVAKLTVGYHTEKQVAAIDATGYNVAAVVPFSSNLNLLANYGKLDNKLAGSTNKDKSITAVGLKYTMSKMTSVYARYIDETNDNVTSATSAKSVKTALIGMQTNF